MRTIREIRAGWCKAAAGGILIAKSTGRLNLCLRSKDCVDPNVWGSWGGGIEDGETPEVAARRELAEEAGYTGPMELTPLYQFKRPGFVYHNFAMVVPEEFEPVTNWENQDNKWFAYGSTPKPMHPGLAEFLADEESDRVIRSLALGVKRRAEARRLVLNGIERLKTARAGQTDSLGHEWDAQGTRCLACGDKDWFASASCSGDKDRQ